MIALEPHTVRCVPARFKQGAATTLQTCFYNAGGNAQVLRFELRTAYAVTITVQVLKALSGVLSGVGVTHHRAQQIEICRCRVRHDAGALIAEPGAKSRP